MKGVRRSRREGENYTCKGLIIHFTTKLWGINLF